MSHDATQPQPTTRAPFTSPVLRVHGNFETITQARTCANGFNDGTGVGCNMSFKKS